MEIFDIPRPMEVSNSKVLFKWDQLYQPKSFPIVKTNNVILLSLVILEFARREQTNEVLSLVIVM